MKTFIYELGADDPVFHQSTVNAQDKFACYSQGEITDRTGEHLGRSDAGVILLRKLFLAGIDDVKAGNDPQGLVRSAPRMVSFENVF